MKVEGIDDLSRSVAPARRASESTVALWQIVSAEAERLGALISLDLFATVDNTLVPRFFARYPEPPPRALTPSPNWTGVSLFAHTAAGSTVSAPRGACWRRSWPRRTPTAFAA
jgi:hypothetical protein